MKRVPQPVSKPVCAQPLFFSLTFASATDTPDKSRLAHRGDRCVKLH